ncbi:zinc finger MYM-type protein 1-like protein [Tanacetum coccineum]
MDSFFPAQLKAKLEEGSSSQRNDTGPETQESENDSGMDIFSKQYHLLMYIIDYYNKQVNRPPLLAPVLCLRFYLSFGIKINEDHPMRIENNDEFVGMIEMVTNGDENFDKDVLNKAPLIQNDLINSCSVETTKAIVNDICGAPNGYFAILVDEYEDDVGDEHIVVCLRYVDKKGDVVEKFLGISRVMDHKKDSYNDVRKMCYDVSGLKTLIKNETRSAYYVHCFAQQLESILESEVSTETRFQKLAQDFEDIEVEIREGSDEKSSSGPHYKSVLKVIDSYDEILDMLDMMANVILRQAIHHSYLSTVMFSLSDQDIVNAMSLVKSVKEHLQKIRNEGWESLLASVVSFCEKNDINVPNMEDMHPPKLRRRNREPEPTTTILHHFQIDVFYSIIDKLLQELNERFDEESMELLVCMACLSPAKSFSSFDKKKLLKLAEFYPNEFSSADLLHLSDQLDKYIQDVKKDKRFKGLNDIKKLSKKLVQVEKHEVFNLVYLLIKLVLILPVATASVQRGFWRMAFVEKELKSNTGDQLLNDRMVTYIERDVFITVSNEDIISNFESKTRQE